MPTPLRIAYADPPYVGQAHKHYSHDPSCAEVDHADLIRRLEVDYDGWALSFGGNLVSLQTVVPLLPEGVRVAVWTKPFASFKPGVNPAYTWEGVAFRSARPNRRDVDTVRDHHAENITLKRGLAGAKPPGFCVWLFDLVGLHPDDVFDDLYPGTGAVTLSWELWQARRRGLPEQLHFAPWTP
jgi:hypothetical protein